MKVVYATEAVHDFLQELESTERFRVRRLLNILEKRGYAIRMPHSKPLGGGIFELRLTGTHAVRILYCYHTGCAYVLHALTKKQDTISGSDVQYAQAVRSRVLAQI